MSSRSSFGMLLVLLVASGCEPPHGPLANQVLGKATGLFAQLPAQNLYCGMLNILGVSMDLTLILPDEQKDTMTLALQPLAEADVHVQFTTSLHYGSVGESTAVVVDVERGHERVNPELEGDVAQQALETRTNLYFPLWVNKARVTAAHLCNRGVLTNELDPNDCVDVPESTLEDAHLWCNIGPNVGQEWTR